MRTVFGLSFDFLRLILHDLEFILIRFEQELLQEENKKIWHKYPIFHVC